MMGNVEKTLTLTSLVYLIIYVFIFFSWTPESSQEFFKLMPFHFIGMGFSFIALVVTLRDLYLREFENSNLKLIWALLILMTGGIGILIYFFKYATKPRSK